MASSGAAEPTIAPRSFHEPWPTTGYDVEHL